MNPYETNTQSENSLYILEQSIEDVITSILHCEDSRALKSYQNILGNLRGYLVMEYELEIKKARFTKDLEGAVLLQMLLNQQLKKIDEALN